MQRINEDIKAGQLKQIYLLHGTERYLIRQYKERLRNAMAADGDAMNLHTYEGKGISVGEVIDLAETMPFLAEKRTIIIENSGFFKASGEQLSEYLKNPAETVQFVFAETEVDKRSKLYKTVRNAGVIVEFTEQDENTLRRWITGILKKEGKQITGEALTAFLGKTGTDMENIRLELEKLICYAMEQEIITLQEVDAITTTRISNHIFDMIHAMASRQQNKALQLYYDLLALKEPPMRILFLIARQFNLLLQVKELKKKGYDKKTIASKAGLQPFLVDRYAAQAGQFRTAVLRRALEACVAADEAVKTGKMTDRMSVELLLVQFSS